MQAFALVCSALWCRGAAASAESAESHGGSADRNITEEPIHEEKSAWTQVGNNYCRNSADQVPPYCQQSRNTADSCRERCASIAACFGYSFRPEGKDNTQNVCFTYVDDLYWENITGGWCGRYAENAADISHAVGPDQGHYCYRRGAGKPANENVAPAPVAPAQRVLQKGSRPILGLLFCIVISGLVLLGFVFRGRRKLPHGIVLSQEELVAHVDHLRVLGVVDSLRHDTPASKSCGPGQVEAVIFNDQKSRIYVFDGDTRDELYIVIEIKGLIAGPPLLPPQSSDGSMLWRPPEDIYIPLSSYLIELMLRLEQEDWSGRIMQELNGKKLVRYQAVVQERFWRKLWDTLLKPFAEQRTAYRGYYKCKRTPDLLFGVNARFVDDSEGTTFDDATENGHDTELAQRSSAEDVEMHEGVPLPAAAEWLECWSQQDFPQRWTFIEFASNLGEVNLPPRSRSFPDLSQPASSEDKTQLYELL
jgi:hypothetical protein